MNLCKTIIRVFSSVVVLAGCSGGATSPTDGASSEGTAADRDDVDQQFATLTRDFRPSDTGASPSADSYLRLQRDVRRCAAPLCGGFFVSRVNRLSTVCADGSRAAHVEHTVAVTADGPRILTAPR